MILFASSRKIGEANKGLGEAPKSCTRKEHESATNPIAKRGQGAIAPCRVKGQRPLWGLGQRPNCFAGDQNLKRTQHRRRQRSVPASNFARPQTRPQAALPPRFREKPEKSPLTFLAPAGCNTGSGICFGKANRLPLHGDFLDLPAVCRQFLLILQKGMVNWNVRNLLNFVEGKRQQRRRLRTHIVPEGIILAHASPAAPQTSPGQQTGSARSAWRCAGNRRA